MQRLGMPLRVRQQRGPAALDAPEGSAQIAVARARSYVRRAIETAPGFGRGHGPLNHAVTVR